MVFARLFRALLALLQTWGLVAAVETLRPEDHHRPEYAEPPPQQERWTAMKATVADVVSLVAACDHADATLLLVSTCTTFWRDGLLKRIMLNHAYGSEGMTKAMLICVHGHRYPPPHAEEELRKLLETDICDVNKQTLNSEDTALHYAVSSAQLDLVELLVGCPSIDPNVSNWSDNVDNGGETPLILAVKQQDRKIVNLLLQCPSIDPNKTDAGGRSALFWAIGTSNTAIIKQLLSCTAIAPNVATKRRENPLSFASERGRVDIVGFLLSNPLTDVNFPSGQQGFTPLMIASSNAWTNLVLTLCQDARCEVNKEAINNWTAMTFAANAEISAILAEHGGV